MDGWCARVYQKTEDYQVVNVYWEQKILEEDLQRDLDPTWANDPDKIMMTMMMVVIKSRRIK